MKSIQDIQKEQAEWATKNFGADLFLRQHDSFLGLTEEWGELIEAVSEEDIADALADIGIFLLGLATSVGVVPLHRFGETYHEVDRDTDVEIELALCISRLGAALLKSRQGIRVDRDHRATIIIEINSIFYWLDFYAKAMEMDYQCILTSTWENVMKRDWSSNKIDGSSKP